MKLRGHAGQVAQKYRKEMQEMREERMTAQEKPNSLEESSREAAAQAGRLGLEEERKVAGQKAGRQAQEPESKEASLPPPSEAVANMLARFPHKTRAEVERDV